MARSNKSSRKSCKRQKPPSRRNIKQGKPCRKMRKRKGYVRVCTTYYYRKR